MSTKRSYFMRPLALIMWTALAASLMMVVPASMAQAAGITVNSRADDTDPADGKCTLREAITTVKTGTPSGAAPGECAPGSSTIDVRVQGTVNLTGPLPDISNMALKGPGADKFTVRRDTGGDYGIFRCGGSCYISGMTIANGKATNGGGILNTGTLEIARSTITNNTADSGGGIASMGSLSVWLGLPNLQISRSTISDNSARLGGGIYNLNDEMVLSWSAVSGNSAAEGGGVASDTSYRPGLIHDRAQTATSEIHNTTISGNTATERGGGVYNSEGRTVIEFSTITNNTAPNGMGSGVESVGEFYADLWPSVRTEVFSTIISGNPGTDVDLWQSLEPEFENYNSFVSEVRDVDSFLTGRGYNLIGDGAATGAFNQTGDQTNVTDPKLGALADNGGPTQTHALQSDSPALDARTLEYFCPYSDQRGVDRPQDGNNDGVARCDIGSFELDTLSPRVRGTNPKRGATGVLPTANVKANFSEAMDVSTINAQTFMLFEEGTNIQVAAKVRYSSLRLQDDYGVQRAILNPTDPLQSGVTYRAVVTTGAEDVTGNALDQRRTEEGNQEESWTFTVG